MNGGATVDLHTHSLSSDGSLTPSELIDLAAQAGIGVLALTDHDTVAGLDEAQRAAGRVGLRLVPGVEISAMWHFQTVHVLGLWIDPASTRLLGALERQAERRRIRMRKMCASLSKAGLPGDDLLAAVEANSSLPTRTHLAAALVAAGHVGKTEDAFRKYLGAGKRAHASADWPELAEVVGLIREAGGVASLAHPMRYKLSSGGRRRLLADFASAGGVALEVLSGANGVHHLQACTALAIKFGLQASVGSDFHNPQLTWNPLGRLAKLPDGIVPVWRDRNP
jgi:predicted metal-dependent phosphoesterase TrpH